MATKKHPSIYDDRSTIGSSDELDEYGVWVKLEPQELSDYETEDFPGLDTDFDPGISLDEAPGGDLSFEDFSDSDGNAGFDDLEALRLDIQSPSPEEDQETAVNDVFANPLITEPTAGPTAGQTDLSTQLLVKIADELSAIKNELSSLKEEISEIRSKKAGEDSEGAGFFGEEDDDKIALTGDELNNIIHTAEFTGETGSIENLDDGFGSPDTVETFSPGDQIALELDKTGDTSANGEEILYDGLGRPLYRSSSDDNPIDDTQPIYKPDYSAADGLHAVFHKGL